LLAERRLLDMSTKRTLTDSMKKTGGETGGQAKIWGGMAHPESPLESPLFALGLQISKQKVCENN